VLILAWFFVTPVIWDVSLLPASRLSWDRGAVQRLTYILNPWRRSLRRIGTSCTTAGRSAGFLPAHGDHVSIVLLFGFFVFNRLKGVLPRKFSAMVRQCNGAAVVVAGQSALTTTPSGYTSE